MMVLVNLYPRSYFWKACDLLRRGTSKFRSVSLIDVFLMRNLLGILVRKKSVSKCQVSFLIGLLSIIPNQFTRNCFNFMFNLESEVVAKHIKRVSLRALQFI